MKNIPIWKMAQRHLVPQSLFSWLTATGSLTRRLQKNSRQGFYVHLLQNGWQKPTPDEALALNIDRRQRVYCREVLLMDGAFPQVYARTVVPIRSYPVLRQKLDELGNQSLGELLFQDPTVKRGTIEISLINNKTPLGYNALKAAGIEPTELWARRSNFKLNGKYLLVSEVFLPGELQQPW